MLHVDKVPSGLFNPSGSHLLRGGIIPYIVVPTDDGIQRLYGFGLDSTSADLTDFGGKRDPDDRDIIDTAIREFDEETLSVFGQVTPQDLVGSTIIYDSQSAIIFYRYEIKPESILPLIQEFKDRAKRLRESEITTLVWLTEDQLRRAVQLNRYSIEGFQPFIIYYPTLRLLNAYFSQ
jgi:hypothetical protein